MKIIYTKEFKEKISQPWSKISLGRVKLREGTQTGLARDDMEKVMNFPPPFTEQLITNRTYDTQVISLPEGGIQIYFNVPEEDQSFYSERYSYQVIMFFYTDLLTNTESLAFVCYEKIGYLGEDDTVIFEGLKLNTRTNIITIPGFSWTGNIEFSQSVITEFLESRDGGLDVNPLLGNSGYVSRESWEAWMVDSVSTPTLTPWIETTYFNKYGIKIY